ncbi:hypothetical protein PS664_00724 [Pseudomonas fluorescens]|nr:hypothetical protein PS664_00724 [Pseudomonas fluorescens]
MPMDRLDSTIHNSKVTIEDPDSLHTFAGDCYQVHVRRTDIQNLIQ